MPTKMTQPDLGLLNDEDQSGMRVAILEELYKIYLSQTIGRIPGLIFGGYIAYLIDISAIFLVSAVIIAFSIPLYARVSNIVINSNRIEI